MYMCQNLVDLLIGRMAEWESEIFNPVGVKKSVDVLIGNSATKGNNAKPGQFG